MALPLSHFPTKVVRQFLDGISKEKSQLTGFWSLHCQKRLAILESGKGGSVTQGETPLNKKATQKVEEESETLSSAVAPTHLKSLPSGAEVSGREEGEALVETVVQLTGLPGTMIRGELESILGRAGSRDEDLTLDELRRAMLIYLESFAMDSPTDEPSPFPKGL